MSEKQNNAPPNWDFAALEDIAEVGAGNPAPQGKQYFCDKGPAFIRVQDMGKLQGSKMVLRTKDQLSSTGAQSLKLFLKGTVLFTKSGASTLLNQRAITSQDCYIVSHIGTAYPFKDILSDWLYHYFTTVDFSKYAHGANMPSMPISKAKGILFPIAPINEQKRIVAKIEELFSELDKGVESLKTAHAQLKIYRQAVLKHAFEGKLTAQWREDNKDKLETADELVQHIQKERETRYQQHLEDWKTSVVTWQQDGKKGKKPAKPKRAKKTSPIYQKNHDELPSLPSCWSWVRLGMIFANSPQNGIYKPASDYGSGTQIIRIDDFYDGELIRKTGFKKLRLNEDEIKTYWVNNLDLLINRVNSIEYLGKCALVEGLSEETVFESNIMKCNILDDLVSKHFVKEYLASTPGRNRLCKNAKHAVNQASINQTDVGETLFPLAPLEEQYILWRIIESKLSQTDKLAEELDEHLTRAVALRQSILKKAFSGTLVAQDPNDEPASVLLKRIKAEKNNNKKKGKAA